MFYVNKLTVECKTRASQGPDKLVLKDSLLKQRMVLDSCPNVNESKAIMADYYFCQLQRKGKQEAHAEHSHTHWYSGTLIEVGTRARVAL